MDNFRHRLNVGVDWSNSHYVTMRPWGYFNAPDGTRTVDIENRRFLTVDYASSFSSGIPGLNSDFNSVLSLGGQYSGDRGHGEPHRRQRLHRSRSEGAGERPDRNQLQRGLRRPEERRVLRPGAARMEEPALRDRGLPGRHPLGLR